MVNISIIVPCYNEEIRGKDFLNQLVNFCKKNLKDYEIILIDDGSRDKTYQLLLEIARKDNNVHFLKNEINLGKGGAVKAGVFESKGDQILFIDADGSISPDQIPNLLAELNDHDIAVGYRYSKESNVTQPFSRFILGTLFNFYVNMIFRIKMYDCLCGFKAFKRNVACDLFENLIDQRWLFDVELFYKAKNKNYSIKTMPIHWVHRDGTKIKPLDPFMFLLQLVNLKNAIDRSIFSGQHNKL